MAVVDNMRPVVQDWPVSKKYLAGKVYFSLVNVTTFMSLYVKSKLHLFL